MSECQNRSDRECQGEVTNAVLQTSQQFGQMTGTRTRSAVGYCIIAAVLMKFGMPFEVSSENPDKE